MPSLVPIVTRSHDVRDQLRNDIEALCELAGVEPHPTPRVGSNAESRAQILALQEQVGSLAAALRVLLVREAKGASHGK